MDELNRFMSNPNVKKIALRGPQTSGMLVTKNDISSQFSRRKENGRRNLQGAKNEDDKFNSGIDYAKEFRRMDDEAHPEIPGSEPGMLDCMENLSSAYDLDSPEHMLSELQLTEVYSKYSFKRSVRDPLPIDSIKEEVLSLLASNSVVIIEGPTGCGKTTQVPQWILEDCYERRRHCNIAVTQPRRIAAISIAKRVAHERACEMGSLVGYQVGLDNKTTTDTRLHYMTTGILLQKFVAAKNMNAYTHVILDEIHERGQEMDFLLLVVKKLLRTVSRGVKVLLMSATFDSAQFIDYFNVASMPGLLGTAYTKVDGRGGFTNTTYYLEQLRRFRNPPEIRFEEPGVTPQGYELVVRLLSQFEEIDAKEDVHEDNELPPSVLVFLPGIHEIEELANCLDDRKYREKVLDKKCPELQWWVVPLHSTITSAEQGRAFQKAPPGFRKVILATNIAESSITVPDIKYVIDFCLMKVMVVDPETHFTSLQVQWASRANCEQRAGRAGRVRHGRVYRLVPKDIYKERFARECTPEMERCPLERLVLLAKMLDMGSPKSILALAMNPPCLQNIRNTILVLKEVGGLLKTFNGEISYEDGDITYLGRIMAKLPVDVRVAKLIMLGYMFGFLEPTIIMGAAMTVKNVFNTPFRDRLNAYNSKLTWADGSRSDCIAFLKVYKVWRHMNRQRNFSTDGNSPQSEARWARDVYVQLRALKELDDMVRELTVRLSREGIDEIKPRERAWSDAEEPLVLKVLLAGAFYPHYYVQQAGDECRERDATKMLGGLDPATTVYLKDFPDKQPGAIYAASIKNAVKNLIMDEPTVLFDNNSNKVYLSFTNSGEMTDITKLQRPKVPGRVALPVYKAVKVRQLNLDISIRCLPPGRAAEVAAELEASATSHVLCSSAPRLPGVADSCFNVRVIHVIDVGHFWIQHDDESTARELAWLHAELNDKPLLAATRTPAPGAACAAPYPDARGNAFYHRAVVHKVLPNGIVWVFYADFGNYGRVNAGKLCELPAGACDELPPLALECTLTEVAPSLLMNQSGWSDEALAFFNYFTQNNKTLYGKVYSVAHGVVSLDLQTREGISLTGELVRRGLARVTEESYDSKLNHDVRECAQDYSLAQQKALNEQQATQALRPLHEAQLPPATEFTQVVRLKGPFSPLERSLNNLMYGGLGKQVQIEWNSVNAVLLDTDPQEPYERLVVAALVGQNAEGSRLTLRHTTMLPNIPGLPCLMALLFAPSAELRRDAARSRYVSVLCGLGAERAAAADAAPVPIFPDHDLLFNIDVDLDNDDLISINHLRHMMNCMMHCPAGQEQPSVSDAEKGRAPGLARKQILTLLTKRRRHREYVAVPHAWEWGSLSDSDLMTMSEELEDAIYPLHDAPRLFPLDPELRQKQLDENRRMHDAVARHVSVNAKQEVMCSLCGVGPMDMQSLRIHLYSRTHRDKEDELESHPI